MPFLNDSSSHDPALLDWRQFAELFAERIRHDCDLEVSIEWGTDLGDTSLLVMLSNGINSLYLGNHYAFYCQNPNDLEEILDYNIQMLRQLMIPNDSIMQCENIMPVIKAGAWLDNMAQDIRNDGGNPDNLLVYKPLADDLFLTYVFHHQQMMQTFDRLCFSEIGINETELHQIALDNLHRYTKGHIQIASDEQSGLSQIFSGSNFDASLILLFGDILAKHLPANPVFAIPARNALFVCSADSQIALNRMQQISAEIYADSPYTISPHLYQYANGEISLFQPH